MMPWQRGVSLVRLLYMIRGSSVLLSLSRTGGVRDIVYRAGGAMRLSEGRKGGMFVCMYIYKKILC